MVKEELMKTLKAWTTIQPAAKEYLEANPYHVVGIGIVALMFITSPTAKTIAAFALLFAAPRLILWALDKYGK